METQIWKTDLWTQQGQERVGRIETPGLKQHVAMHETHSYGKLPCNSALSPGLYDTLEGRGEGVGGRLTREGTYVYL